MCNKNGISSRVGRGGGGPFCELVLETPEEMGVIGKIPSVEGYGYFLELHNVKIIYISFISNVDYSI